MSAETFRFRKISLGLTRKYRIRADHGGGRPGAVFFSLEKAETSDDWYRLIVLDERFDRRLLFALAVTMEARQRG